MDFTNWIAFVRSAHFDEISAFRLNIYAEIPYQSSCVVVKYSLTAMHFSSSRVNRPPAVGDLKGLIDFIEIQLIANRPLPVDDLDVRDLSAISFTLHNEFFA